MTEREFEQRLRNYYRAEADAAGRLPVELREGVLGIPDRMRTPIGFFQTRRGFVVLAATAMLTALLLGVAIAIGSGLLRLPWEEDQDTVLSRNGGWVAYVVALTDWNTPGGPTFETPGSPTRIAIVKEGTSTPIYLGGVTPPATGASTEEWLSVRQQCPVFSPDGTHLAYFERQSTRGGSSSGMIRGAIVIATMDELALETEPGIRITDVPESSCPQWSPDSRSVAFVNEGGFEVVPRVTVAALDGSERDFPLEPDGSVIALAWSPDGSSIATILNTLANGCCAEGSLWLIPLDGREPRILYEGHTPMFSFSGRWAPSWSADGTLIAITASATPEPTPDAEGGVSGYEEDWRVLIVPADDGVPVQEIGRGIGPVWAPAGQRLAYLAVPARDAHRADTGSVVVVDTATGTEHVIPEAPIPVGTPLSEYNMEGGSGFWQPHEPQWSPDGETLLFIGSDGVWGTSVLLEASATGDEIPVAVSETWVAEWYGSNPFSWQVDLP